MVVNLNMDLETRLADMYKNLAAKSSSAAAAERKELSPDEFWSSMRMVATNNQAFMNYQTPNQK
jgi:hypothetical protein